MSGDSFQNACVSSSPLGIGKQIRIPKMQLAFRSNSKDKERHIPNFVAKHWFHLTVLTRSGFCSCQLLQPRCSNSLIHPSTCLLSCAFFFHLLLLLPAFCSRGFYWNLPFLWIFSVIKEWFPSWSFQGWCYIHPSAPCYPTIYREPQTSCGGILYLFMCP